jgi:hypothetical protein
MIMQNNCNKTAILNEPVCWNCQRAQRIESYRTVFVPCELFYENQPCEFLSYTKIRCIDCANFEENTGCLYGVSHGDSRCFFKPAYNIPKKKERPESEWPHEEILCPYEYPIVSNKKNKCNGNLYMNFDPCEACPLDWSKLRISFKIKEKPTKLYDYEGYELERNDNEPVGN